jgi:hypothetical protein
MERWIEVFLETIERGVSPADRKKKLMSTLVNSFAKQVVATTQPQAHAAKRDGR